jgi:hypothetical protein
LWHFNKTTREKETMAKGTGDLSAFVGRLLEEQDGYTLRGNVPLAVENGEQRRR